MSTIKSADRAACAFFLILIFIGQAAFGQSCPNSTYTVTVPKGTQNVKVTWSKPQGFTYVNEVWNCDCAKSIALAGAKTWNFSVKLNGSELVADSGSISAYGYGPIGDWACPGGFDGNDATPPSIPSATGRSETFQMSSATATADAELEVTVGGCSTASGQYLGNATYPPGQPWSSTSSFYNFPNFEMKERYPVIFIPGIAASQLRDRTTNSTTWLSVINLFNGRLTLDPRLANPPDTYASKLLPGTFGNPGAYDWLVLTLQGGGYTLYDFQDETLRRTTAGCDMSQTSASLFLFPYDWRKDNELAVDELADYVGCIRRLHPDKPIDIVAHSMGGLVGKRLIDRGGVWVNRYITIATPFAGAPKAVWVLETGGFLGGAGGMMTSWAFEKISPWMPALHQLLPTAHYFNRLPPGVAPPLIEDGWDLNGNGTTDDRFTYEEMVSVLDARYPNLPPIGPPGTTNLNFHGPLGEADFWDDWDGAYTHFYGNSGAYSTVQTVKARKRVDCASSSPSSCVDVLYWRMDKGPGDSTVPLVSSMRTDTTGSVSPCVKKAPIQDWQAHTSLPGNAYVRNSVLTLLNKPVSDTPDCASAVALVPARRVSVMSDPEARVQLHLELVGAQVQRVTDSLGNQMRFDVTDDFTDSGNVPGLTVDGLTSTMAYLVFDEGPVYTVDFTVTGPILAELLRFVGDAGPDTVTRYHDLPNEIGRPGRLVVGATGAPQLAVDLDGDGEFETGLAPASQVSGTAATDVTPPQIAFTASAQGATRTVTVTSTDDLSGLARLIYSVDGGQTFQPYTAPVSVAQAVRVHAFADDLAGNRSRVYVEELTGPPALTSISPSSGYPGTEVTLTGTNFGATQGSGSVWLGSKLADSISSWTHTTIVATVAAGAASGNAIVQQGGDWSNSIAFTVITPNITGISPSSGYPGTEVTISGTDFGATQGSGSVWLGNKLAGSIVNWSDTEIVAVVAAGATSGNAIVQQQDVWGNSVAFTVIAPNITSISPATGFPGTQVTFTGTNFGTTQGTGSVWLGNKYAGSIVSWSDTAVVATVAANAASGSAQMQQQGVWSNTIAFTVPTPNITSISPASGVAGTQVTFTGTNFGATQGTGSVWLGSKLAGSIVSWSNTHIVATVASGSVTGSAQVQQGSVWSNSIPFTVTSLSLASVSPTTARAGDSITLTGANFGASQGTGSVWLGNKLASSIVSWSSTQIVAIVASGAKSGSAQVQQGGVWSSAITFTVITPNVSSLSPASGPVGTQVTITGTGFGATQGSGLVWIGTKYATVVSWSDTQVVATVAAASATGGTQVYQNGVWSNAVTFTVAP